MKYRYLKRRKIHASPVEEQIVFGIKKVNNNSVKGHEEIVMFLVILIVEIFILSIFS